MNMSDNINLENEENVGRDELGAPPETEEIEMIEELDETKETEEFPEDLKKKCAAAIMQLREEFDALNDKYLRLYAEYENFRKRTAKEKEEIYSGAVADVLKDILPVLDNFERALQFSGDEPEKVSEGLKMIEAQFAAAFARIGVEEIQAAGEQFNPELHYAVAHEQDESQLENTVADVLQKGYIKGDRVIRPAMVKVVN